MAATGKTPILLYGSTTATNAPVAGNLTNSSDGCEIAINVADKNLFFKDSTNVVNTVPIRQSSTSSNGWLSSADWNTFNGKASAVTYTTNYIPYGQGTTTPNQSANLTFNGTSFGVGTTAYTYTIQAQNGAAGASVGATNSGGGSISISIESNATSNARLSYTNQCTAYGGNIIIDNGNLVIGTSGKGIDFSATAGTGTSELLADYEEGTFTPTVIGSTSAGTASYFVQQGSYTKIGRLVSFQIYLAYTGGNGTGELQITGLPYVSGSGLAFGFGCTPLVQNIALTANNYCTGAFVLSSDIKMRFFQTPIGGGTASPIPYDGEGELMVSGQYYS